MTRYEKFEPSDHFHNTFTTQPHNTFTTQPHIPVNPNTRKLKNINNVLDSMDDKHNATYNTLIRILYILNNADPSDFPPINNGESAPAGMLGWLSMQENKASFINDLANEIACLLGAEDN